MTESAKSKSKLTADSLPEIEATRFGGDRSAFLDWLNQEVNRLVFADLAQCEKLIAQIEALRRRFTGEDRARLLRMIARFYHMTGKPAEALKVYNAAERIYRGLGDRLSPAMIAKAKIDALMYLGRYPEALKIGRQAGAYFRRHQRSMDQAQVLSNMGNVYHRMDDSPRALRCYNRARDLMGDTAPPNFLATIDYNRANILSNLNRLNEAEKLYAQAGEKYHEAGLEVNAEHCVYSLGYLQFLRGRYARAQERFEHVREKLGSLGDRRGRAVAELDIMEILLATSRFSEAQGMAADLQEQFKQLKMNYERGKVMTFSARALMRMGDFAPASHMLTGARRIFGREDNKLWSTIAVFHAAELALVRGRLADAMKLARDSAQRFKNLGDHIRAAYALILIAQLEFQRSRAAQAGRILSPLMRQENRFPAAVLFPAYHLLGKIADDRGKMKEAISAYQNSLRQLRVLTGGISADESRMIFLSDKYDVFRDLSSALVQSGRHKAAFKVAEEARRQVHDDFRAEIPDMESVAIPDDLQVKRDTLRAVLRKLYTPEPTGQRAVGGDVGKIRKAEHQLWQTEQHIRRFFYGHLSRSPQSELKLDELYRRLGPRTALIGYTRLRDGWGAYLADSRGLEYVPLPVSDEQLTDLLGRMYFFLEKNAYPGSYRRRNDLTIVSGTNNYFRRIAELIWHPLEQRVQDCERLVIIPHRQLAAAPFHALPAQSGNPLYQRWKLELAGSVAGWLGRLNQPVNDSIPGAIFAPVGNGTPGVQQEIEAVHSTFPTARVFQDSAATRDQLRSVLSEAAEFVHIISHASISLTNPFCSEILLADGPFYGFDLFGTPVKSDLVTLSACQTGRPGFFGELDTTALADAFLMAGARRAIGSLWPVSDSNTAEFMSVIYEQWAKNKKIYTSWKHAVDYIREKHDNPYRWAPFRILGRLD